MILLDEEGIVKQRCFIVLSGSRSAATSLDLSLLPHYNADLPNMFETLTDQLNQVFDQLRRRGKLSEADVDAAMREVRLALLEADVHFSVVKTFIAHVHERAVGAEVSKALNPGQQIIKIVNEELIATLGEPAPLNLSGPKPRMIMLVGLQGSGKTTAAGKLARLLRSKGERVMLVAGDPYRPAAVQQLQQLGEKIDVPVEADLNLKPPELAKRAFDKGEKGGIRRRDFGYRWSVAVGCGIDERVEIHRLESHAC